MTNVGVATARGTGTNGFIQKNLSYISKKREIYDYNKESTHLKPLQKRKPNAEILEHENKRLIEIKCLELQDKLESMAKYSNTEIQEKIQQLRTLLLSANVSKDVKRYFGLHLVI